MALLKNAIRELPVGAKEAEQLEWTRIGNRWREDISALAARARGGDTYAATVLASRLEDRRPEVRFAAAEGLGIAGQHGMSELRDAIAVYLTHERPEVRQAAMKAFGHAARVGDERATALVAKRLHDDCAVVRMAALEALCMIRPNGFQNSEDNNGTYRNEMDATLLRLEDADVCVAFMAVATVVHMFKPGDRKTINDVIGSKLVHRSGEVVRAGLQTLTGLVQKLEVEDVHFVVDSLTACIDRVIHAVDDLDGVLRYNLIDALAMVAELGHETAIRSLSAFVADWHKFDRRHIELDFRVKCQKIGMFHCELEELEANLEQTLNDLNKTKPQDGSPTTIARGKRGEPSFDRARAQMIEVDEMRARIKDMTRQRDEVADLAKSSWQLSCASVAVLGKLAFSRGWLSRLEQHLHHMKRHHLRADVSSEIGAKGYFGEEPDASYLAKFIDDVLSLLDHPRPRSETLRSIERVAVGLREGFRGQGVAFDSRNLRVGTEEQRRALAKLVQRQRQFDESSRSFANKHTFKPAVLESLPLIVDSQQEAVLSAQEARPIFGFHQALLRAEDARQERLSSKETVASRR